MKDSRVKDMLDAYLAKQTKIISNKENEKLNWGSRRHKMDTEKLLLLLPITVTDEWDLVSTIISKFRGVWN